MRPVVQRLVAHLDLDSDLMNPPRWQAPSDPAHGFAVLMRMLARQLLQGLSSPLRQSNDTFHGQTGHQDGMARQARHSEIRLLNTLNSLFDILIRMSKA